MKSTGSAKRLIGKNLVLSIFISEPSSPWQQEAKDEIFDMIYEAEDWLEEQANLYSKKIYFNNEAFGLEEDIVLDYIPPTDGEFNWVKEAGKIIGYPSIKQLYRTVKEDSNNFIVLLFANKEGRSFALPYEKGLDSEYFLEGSILYKAFEGETINPATIAHEILHLYGAWDLYSEDGDNSLESLAREKMSGDIMLELKPDIFENAVKELTAYLVGWKEEEKDWYDIFRPKN